MQYIGETSRKLKDRFSDHLSYVRSNASSQPTGFHFNSSGHSISDMKICIVEKVSQDSKIYRLEREKFFIEKFKTKWKGLNKKL